MRSFVHRHVVAWSNSSFLLLLCFALCCNLPTANQKSDKFQICLVLRKNNKQTRELLVNEDDALGTVGGWSSRYDPGILTLYTQRFKKTYVSILQAWALGANDVANAVRTFPSSVSAKLAL